MEPGLGTWHADISRCRKGVDIPLFNVGPSDSDHHLWVRSAAAVREAGSGAASRPQRRDHARGERTYLCWTSGALWGPAVLRDTAESPAPLSSKLFSRWRLPQSTNLRRWTSCTLRRQPTTLPLLALGRLGNWRLDGYTDSNVQLARETVSSSSSGMAVPVSKSSRSWSPDPPSSAGTCPQWCRALSMMPAKSHSALDPGIRTHLRFENQRNHSKSFRAL